MHKSTALPSRKLSTRRNKPGACAHPPAKYYAWHARNHETGKNDILCIGCTVCGKVLQGAANE